MQKRPGPFQLFPMFPEPVLANDHLCHTKRRFPHRSGVVTIAEPPLTLASSDVCGKRPLFPHRVQCLSRACLGKMIVFTSNRTKWLQQGECISHRVVGILCHTILLDPIQPGGEPRKQQHYRDDQREGHGDAEVPAPVNISVSA